MPAVPSPAYGRIRALADPTRGGSGQTVADVGEGHGARRFVTPSILSAGVQFATAEQLPVQLRRTGPTSALAGRAICLERLDSLPHAATACRHQPEFGLEPSDLSGGGAAD